MRRTVPACVVLALLAIAVAGSACAAPPAGITLDAKSQAAGRIRTAPLQAAEGAQRVAAYGVVLDPGPLIRLAADIAAARGRLAVAAAKLALARGQAARASELYRDGHNVSEAHYQDALARLRVAEADESEARAQAREVAARARSDWGARLAAAAADGAAPLPQIEGGSLRLVEASVALGASLPGAPAAPVAVLPDGAHVRLRVVGQAPRAAAAIAGPGVYCVMPADAAAPIGTPLALQLRASRRQAGVLVPASAVVWHDGRALVYMQRGAASFTAVAIATPAAARGGYFVPLGEASQLRPGRRVVIAGAELLYSASRSALAPAAASAPGHLDRGVGEGAARGAR